MKKIISSGSIAMDFLFDCSELPVHDGFARLYSEKMLPGGSSANVIVAAANYGLETYQVGKVGDDVMGESFIKSLRDDNVNTDYMYIKNGGVTMHTYVITAPEGKHTILANFGTCMLDFKREELPADILDGIDIVYSDLFSADVSDYLVTEGAKQGKIVVYNMESVTSFLETCGTPRTVVDNALNNCTLLIGGDAPYLELAPAELQNDIEAAVKYVADKYDVPDGAICTLGSKGAIWYDGKEMHRAAAYHVEDVVDTTGCGDAFLGSIMFAYYDKGMSIDEAMDFANAAAAIKCRFEGARLKVSESEVNAFRKSK